MSRLCIPIFLLLLATGPAGALTYSWTDNAGVAHFTDSPETIPSRYEHRVVTREDITIRDPKIREEVRKAGDLERHEGQTSAAPREPVPTPVATPRSVPTPEQQEIQPTVTPPMPIWNLCAPGQPLTVACAPGPLPKKSDKTS